MFLDEDQEFANDLGERLRRLRKERGISQTRLAERAGVTKSFVSQVESGKVMPSITTVRRLTGALGYTLAQLFAEAPTPEPHDQILVRADRRRSITMPGRHVQLYLLAPDVHRAMEPVYNIVRPGQATAEEPMTHEGEEWLYVVKGFGRLLVGGDQLTLGPGDAAYFSSNVPHRVINEGTEPLEIIWVVTPPLY